MRGRNRGSNLRIKPFLYAISFLIALASTVLWARSYWIGDAWQTIEIQHQGSETIQLTRAVIINRGTINFSRARAEISELHARSYRVQTNLLHDSSKHITFKPINDYLPIGQTTNSSMKICFGFGWGRINAEPDLVGTAFLLPFWSIVVACSIIPSVNSIAALRKRRKDNLIGKCVNCGYDLRATIGRCPECGVVGKSSAPKH